MFIVVIQMVSQDDVMVNLVVVCCLLEQVVEGGVWFVVLLENFVVMGWCDLVELGCVEVWGNGFILLWLNFVVCDFRLWIVVGMLLLLLDG